MNETTLVYWFGVASGAMILFALGWLLIRPHIAAMVRAVQLLTDAIDEHAEHLEGLNTRLESLEVKLDVILEQQEQHHG